jgi:predicted RecA/RadA family phage recombinase
VHPSCVRRCSWPVRVEAGQGASVLDARSRVLPEPGDPGGARAGAGGPRLRGQGAREIPCRLDLVCLLVSELVTNSALYSGSAVPGGVVMVTVASGDEVVRVEVTDRIGDGVPVLPSAPADDEAEGSRGLWFVDALSARWGYQRAGGLATTWFELGQSG